MVIVVRSCHTINKGNNTSGYICLVCLMAFHVKALVMLSTRFPYFLPYICKSPIKTILHHILPLTIYFLALNKYFGTRFTWVSIIPLVICLSVHSVFFLHKFLLLSFFECSKRFHSFLFEVVSRCYNH